MAATITRASSRQTDLTIRYLVDQGMVEDAYRAYGYFRWVDDWLDQGARPRQERLAFVARQIDLMNTCYQGGPTGVLLPEETKQWTAGLHPQYDVDHGLRRRPTWSPDLAKRIG